MNQIHQTFAEKKFEQASFLSQTEKQKLLKKLPELKKISDKDLEERIIVLSSLQFQDFKELVLTYPELLLIETFQLGENIQKLMKKYRDMELAQRAFLKKYAQNKE